MGITKSWKACVTNWLIGCSVGDLVSTDRNDRRKEGKKQKGRKESVGFQKTNITWLPSSSKYSAHMQPLKQTCTQTHRLAHRYTESYAQGRPHKQTLRRMSSIPSGLLLTKGRFKRPVVSLHQSQFNAYLSATLTPLTCSWVTGLSDNYGYWRNSLLQTQEHNASVIFNNQRLHANS